MCVCVCVLVRGVVTQWYCSEGEGNVVHNHYVESLGVIPRNTRTTDESTSSGHVTGTKGWEHVKTIIKETDYVLQQLFNPDKTGVKFKYKMKAVMAPNKELYMDMQKMEKQSNIASVFVK